MHLAKTIACVDEMPILPGQNFAALIVGVWITNWSVLVSRVAVVSIPATLDP